MNKIETVAPMAATIFGSAARQELQPVQEGLAHSIAAQAWALYDAVEQRAADRHSHGSYREA